MLRVRKFIFCLLLAFSLRASGAETNLLVWHKGGERVDADVRGEPLWPLLQSVAGQTGWRIYVEPGAAHTASAKFKNLQAGDALKMLLGDLNFALVPQSNSPAHLYVFSSEVQNAT